MARSALKHTSRRDTRSKPRDSSPKKSGKPSATHSGRNSGKEQSEKHSAAFSQGPRPLWTGVVAFGLVSMPVSLYSATRHWGSSLKMVDASGQPLSRRYRCEKDDIELSSDDIIRGYEVEEGRFVTVEDDELRALAPEKSSEINLQKFISLDDIHPIYFDKSYFLVPDPAAVRAYRLLAESMASERRAGIATFVMRDKEYLVAIISEEGILSAETLRFHDEIRTPAEIGLPKVENPDKSLVKQLEKAIEQFSEKNIDRNELEDRQTLQVQKLAATKLKKGIDVIKDKRRSKRSAEIARDDYDSDMEAVDKVIDLMKVLKARIEKETNGKSGKGRSASLPSARNTRRQDLADLTRDELYEKARVANLEGRSKMSRQQLLDALSR